MRVRGKGRKTTKGIIILLGRGGDQLILVFSHSECEVRRTDNRQTRG